MPASELFGREFHHLDSHFLGELHDLKQEGALYAQFWREELGQFGFCRIRFEPEEIVAYVEASTAYDEFTGWLERLSDPAQALEKVSSTGIRERVLEYNRWAEREQPDTMYCFAAFAGDHLEGLISGALESRYEFLSETYRPDRRFLLMEILEAFPDAVAHLTARKGGRPSYVAEQEADVHDLLYATIKCIFPDARSEDFTPQHAGGSKRIDIVIPRISVVVEVKYVRDASHARRIADELKIDFESYHKHEDCGRLVAYVWDPGHHLADRSNFIQDLVGARTKGDHTFMVEVYVKP